MPASGEDKFEIHGTQYPQLEVVLNNTAVHSFRQCERRRFYDDPDRMVWVQPAPWSRCCVLG